MNRLDGSDGRLFVTSVSPGAALVERFGGETDRYES